MKTLLLNPRTAALATLISMIGIASFAGAAPAERNLPIPCQVVAEVNQTPADSGGFYCDNRHSDTDGQYYGVYAVMSYGESDDGTISTTMLTDSGGIACYNTRADAAQALVKWKQLGLCR